MAAEESMEGIDFSPEGIRNVKDALTNIRDAALRAADWESTVLFTHIIVYLGDYALKVERERGKESDANAGCVPPEGEIKRVSQDGKHSAEWNRPGVHIKATWKDED